MLGSPTSILQNLNFPIKLRNRKHTLNLHRNLKNIFPLNSVSTNHSPQHKKINSQRKSIQASVNLQEVKRQKSSAQIRRRIRTLNTEDTYSKHFLTQQSIIPQQFKTMNQQKRTESKQRYRKGLLPKIIPKNPFPSFKSVEIPCDDLGMMTFYPKSNTTKNSSKKSFNIKKL